MSSIWAKIGVIVLMIVAEGIAIGSEVLSAKYFHEGQSVSKVLLKMSPIVMAGAVGLILAYIWGYRSFGNIWVVTVLSITAILIVEPVIVYAVFKELPTKGAILGFLFGVAGFFATLFVK